MGLPESVPVLTSVTTGRPGRLETRLGEFLYRHVHPRWFWGYREEDVGDGDRASIALPEKALLDLFCFTPGSISAPFVRELRLAAHAIDTRRLQRFAGRMGRPKAIRAAALASRVLAEDDDGGDALT
jgi:hypothetical protein